MGAGEWLTLAIVAAVVAAVILGKRKGTQAHNQAVADARAAGYADAEAAAAARADARATGGSVVVNGLGFGPTAAAAVESDEYSALASGIVRAELRRMDALQRRRFLDEIGVGDLFPGVQHGPDAGDGHEPAVRDRGVHGGELPPARVPPVMPYAGQG